MQNGQKSTLNQTPDSLWTPFCLISPLLLRTHNQRRATPSFVLLNQSDSLQSGRCGEFKQLQRVSTRDLSEESAAVRLPPPFRSRTAKHVLWGVSWKEFPFWCLYIGVRGVFDRKATSSHSFWCIVCQYGDITGCVIHQKVWWLLVYCLQPTNNDSDWTGKVEHCEMLAKFFLYLSSSSSCIYFIYYSRPDII